MKKSKNIYKILLTFLVCIIYLFFMMKKHFLIPCIFHEITGLHCPGCGITRMIISILQLNLYQAFRYNMLIFVLFPFFLVLLFDYGISYFIKKEPLYKKVSRIVWYIVIFLLIVFGILRNIFPFLAPVVI